MVMTVAKRLFTVDEYYRMAEVGILRPGDHVELLDGEVVQMSPISSRHAACVRRFQGHFSTQTSGRALVSVQSPVRLNDLSEPEPDLALLVPRSDFYAASHPTPKDILLLVEVAETSAVFDLGAKALAYARAGIPEFWVADLPSLQVVLHSDPSPNGYRSIRIARRGERLTPLLVAGVEMGVEDALGYDESNSE